MQKEFSNNLNKNNYAEPSNIAEEIMICKDGFCSLANQKEIPKQNKKDMNLFDPI